MRVLGIDPGTATTGFGLVVGQGGRANELRLHLNQLLSNQPVEILPGNRVIEIRPYGIHKGRIVPPMSPERLAATTIVAIGDDRTDEDLFSALPPEAITIRVGTGPTRARFRLEGVAAVRQLLQTLELQPSSPV